MAVQRECTHNKAGVVVDVTNGQEYLRYRVCITQGARNDGLIVDQDERVILDEDHETSARCREREWPSAGELAAIGDQAHALVMTFVRAVQYSYKVTLHNEDGSLKTVVKDCKYTREAQTDTKVVGIVITVV